MAILGPGFMHAFPMGKYPETDMNARAAKGGGPMRALFRLLSCVLCASLLVVPLSLAGCGRGEADDAPSVETAAQTARPSGSTDTGGFGGDVREEVLVPGPEDKVTAWAGDIAMPFVNPYGERDKYADVAFEADGDVQLSWIGADNRMTTQTFHGGVWTMTVDEVGETADFLRRMKTHAFAKGMTNLLQPENRLWAMRGTDGDGARWWGQAEYTAGSCRVTVVRERRLEAGNPLVIRTADFEAARAGFLVEHPGDRFLTLKVEFSQGSVSLDGERRNGYDAYTRDIRFQADVADVQGNAFLFDGLPQDPGYQSWDVSWEDENRPETITLTLYEVAPLPGVTVRETLGAIRVRNAAFGHVTVAPYLGDATYLDHPEYDESSLPGDVTPEGDAIFWLPPGYWDVLVQPAQEALGTCRTCLVPVQAGRETIVTLPGSLQAAYAPRGLEPGDERGMEIVRAEDRGAEAELLFTLADPDTRDILPDLANTASLWSVSAFSLELDDDREILSKAKAYAMGIKDAFEFKAGPAGYSVGGLPEISGSANGIKATLGTGGITLGQDLLGFANGYADGVAYYFSKAK